MSKTINLCVVKLSNSWAKADPMSEASVVGLACVPRLDLDYFESQSDSPRLNQRFLKKTPIVMRISANDYMALLWTFSTGLILVY